MLSQPPAGEDELGEFYRRFEGVKDFHRRNKGINTRQFVNDLDELVKGDGLQVIQVEDDEEPMIVERKFASVIERRSADPGSTRLCLLRRRSIRETPRSIPVTYSIPQSQRVITSIILWIPRHATSRQNRKNAGCQGEISSGIPRIRPDTLQLPRIIFRSSVAIDRYPPENQGGGRAI